jgi:hypothetical protein
MTFEVVFLMGPRGFTASSLLVLLILGSVPFPGYSENPTRNSYSISGNLITGNVEISGVSEFIDFIQEIDAPGNGTLENPYVIDGYSFDANGGDHCLSIWNLSRHFKIQNCNFTGSNSDESSSALYMNKVTNYSIGRSSFFDNGLVGAYLHKTKGNVSSSTFENNSKEGLVVYRESNLINSCKFSGNSFGLNSTGENEVTDCSFNGNSIGLVSFWTRELVCDNCTFTENVNGIQATSFRKITNCHFSRNHENGIYIEIGGNYGGNDIESNTFIDNDENGILLKKYYIQDDFTNITNNTIKGSDIGINTCGKTRIEGNIIEMSEKESIRIVMGRSILRNNTLKGPGISFNSHYSNVDLDDSTLLNDLPILYISNEKDIMIDSKHSQIFLEYCEEIHIKNQEERTEPYSISLTGCEDIGISYCSLRNINVVDVKDLLIMENNISGFINGTNSYLNAYRNNFNSWPFIYFGVWEWSHDFELRLDNNYYREYPVTLNSTSDGIYWHQDYSHGVGGPDKHTRVFPLGYNGSKQPIFLEDLTSGSVLEGDNLRFAVRVTDYHIIRDVKTEISINGNLEEIELKHEAGDLWEGEIKVPIDVQDLYYRFNATSVSSLNSLTYYREIDVIDGTPPVIIDRSNATATTGESFTILASVEDNRGIQEVKAVYSFGTGPKKEIILQGGPIYSGHIGIPLRSVIPLNFRVHARDFEGNEGVSELKSVTIVDNEIPIIVLPDIIETITWKDTLFDASGCTDNIGIVNYTWKFGEGFTRYELNGMIQHHTFRLHGTYNVSLTVRDERGNQAIEFFKVIVGIPPDEDKRFLEVTMGPILDNSNGEPISEVRVTVTIHDLWIIEHTDERGIVILSLTPINEETRISINLTREYYSSVQYDDILLPSGKLKFGIPGMDRYITDRNPSIELDDDDEKNPETEEESNEEDRSPLPFPVLLLVVLVSILIIFVILIVVYRSRIKD